MSVTARPTKKARASARKSAWIDLAASPVTFAASVGALAAAGLPPHAAGFHCALLVFGSPIARLFGRSPAFLIVPLVGSYPATMKHAVLHGGFVLTLGGMALVVCISLFVSSIPSAVVRMLCGRSTDRRAAPSAVAKESCSSPEPRRDEAVDPDSKDKPPPGWVPARRGNGPSGIGTLEN